MNKNIGSENLRMQDCPFHLPKQNLEFFNLMKNAVNVNSHGNQNYRASKTASETTFKGKK